VLYIIVSNFSAVVGLYILGLAISSVTSTMWPRRKIKQNLHFLSQVIYLP
jgi:hypothetical protein